MSSIRATTMIYAAILFVMLGAIGFLHRLGTVLQRQRRAQAKLTDNLRTIAGGDLGIVIRAITQNPYAAHLEAGEPLPLAAVVVDVIDQRLEQEGDQMSASLSETLRETRKRWRTKLTGS